MKKNKKISENYIINKYLKKLNYSKKETFNFENDAAYLKIPKNKQVVVTNDTIIENIDFFQKDPPESLANKIITYNLSDLSSMGATPYAYTLSLCLPGNIKDQWLKRFTKKLYLLQKKLDPPSDKIMEDSVQEMMEKCYLQLQIFYQEHDLDWSKSLEEICKELGEVAENAEDENETVWATNLLDECLKLL